MENTLAPRNEDPDSPAPETAPEGAPSLGLGLAVSIHTPARSKTKPSSTSNHQPACDTLPAVRPRGGLRTIGMTVNVNNPRNNMAPMT